KFGLLVFLFRSECNGFAEIKINHLAPENEVVSRLDIIKLRLVPICLGGKQFNGIGQPYLKALFNYLECIFCRCKSRFRGIEPLFGRTEIQYRLIDDLTQVIIGQLFVNECILVTDPRTVYINFRLQIIEYRYINRNSYRLREVSLQLLAKPHYRRVDLKIRDGGGIIRTQIPSKTDRRIISTLRDSNISFGHLSLLPGHPYIRVNRSRFFINLRRAINILRIFKF